MHHIDYDPDDDDDRVEFHEQDVREKVTKLVKYKVVYELRSTHEVTVDARTPQEAQDMVCGRSYQRHGESIYCIEEVEPIEIHKENIQHPVVPE